MRVSILWFLLVVVSFGCEEKIRPSVLDEHNTLNLASQESWNTKVVFSDSGRIKAVLHAGHILVYQEKQITVMDGGVKADFFDADENHTSVLTSLRGTVDDRTRNFEAISQVVVVSDSGTTLETERLLWDNATRKVRTNEFVKIVSANEQIRGHGLESDQDLKNYKIFRVTGQTITE